MNKKYELTSECITLEDGRKLYRIRALIDLPHVKAGELGGYVEYENNLSHDGNAWIFGDARVFGNAWVFGNALVFGNTLVFGNAWVFDNAEVYGTAKVYGDAEVSGNAKVFGNALVFDNAEVSGDAEVHGDARAHGDASVHGGADFATIEGFGTCFRTTTFFRCKDGEVRVSCGCFYGTIPEFREQVKKTREGKIAKEYLMIADLMELHFKDDCA